MSSAAQNVPLGDEARDAISLVEGPPSWVERFSDRLNPIFVKETRQALKSKQFVISFLLLLAFSWLVSLFFVLTSGGDLESGRAGRELFSIYFGILAVAIMLVSPFGAFRSLLTEREDATYEPLVITTLHPRQIVMGKFLSAVLQTFLYYSAIAPFISFTALMQGFDIAQVSLILFTGLLFSMAVTMAALALSSMIKGKVWQTITSLAVLFGLFWAFILAVASTAENWAREMNHPEFWWAYGALLLGGLTYVLLLQQIAVANITFEAGNRSTGLRVISLTQFVLLWGGLAITASIWSSGHHGELYGLGLILSTLHWSIAAWFFVTERDFLSHRIIRTLPRSAPLRLLLAPLYPGGSRGLVLSILVGSLLWGFVLIGLRLFPPTRMIAGEIYNVSTGVALYFIIYANMAAMVARWMFSLSDTVNVIHTRVISLLVMAVSMILPMFQLLFVDYYRYTDYHLGYLPNPVFTMEELARRHTDSIHVLMALLIWALLMTLINVPAMLRGLREMVQAQPVPATAATKANPELFAA